ncbi:hypothetical protein EDB86DRAFT_1180102 [Lactarius hatsudake]|nr:hypothetical protein EDB86DRAFT_1180102 [Lactarius hatsudake]
MVSTLCPPSNRPSPTVPHVNRLTMNMTKNAIATTTTLDIVHTRLSEYLPPVIVHPHPHLFRHLQVRTHHLLRGAQHPLVRPQRARGVLRVPPQLSASSFCSAVLCCGSTDADSVPFPVLRAPVVDAVRSGGRKARDSSAKLRSRSTSAPAAAAKASASSVVRRPDVMGEGSAGRWSVSGSGFRVTDGDGCSTERRNNSRRKGSGATCYHRLGKLTKVFQHTHGDVPRWWIAYMRPACPASHQCP